MYLINIWKTVQEWCNAVEIVLQFENSAINLTNGISYI